ncbi:MAG: hypothetical protein JSR62_01455 [Nitrospira sp.]|nr:hypothetical protein [Nitrospira sp.]
MSRRPTDIQHLRQKAEEVLAEADTTGASTASKKDTVSLLHELQVHHIELEMQCEELRRTQQELEQSRDRYAELYDTIPVGSVTINNRGIISDINATGASMLKSSKKALHGRRMQLFMPLSERKRFSDFCNQLAQQKRKLSCEIALGDGCDASEEVAMTVLLEGTPAHGREGLLRLAMVDISGRKAAEDRLKQHEAELQAGRQKLQDTNATIVHAVDEERRAIARELHDDCCQQLAMLMMSATGLERTLAEPASRKLRAMGQQIKQVLDSLRHIAYGLHPAMGEPIGIEAAIRTYLTDFIEVTDLVVEFHSVDVPERVPQSISLCLIRTLQESVHNIVKYAEATSVEVRLFKEGATIRLVVADNGRGFDVDAAKASSRGMGLASIRERLELLNGTVEIASVVGKGTTVRISVPFAESVQHPA